MVLIRSLQGVSELFTLTLQWTLSLGVKRINRSLPFAARGVMPWSI